MIENMHSWPPHTWSSVSAVWEPSGWKYRRIGGPVLFHDGSRFSQYSGAVCKLQMFIVKFNSFEQKCPVYQWFIIKLVFFKISHICNFSTILRTFYFHPLWSMYGTCMDKYAVGTCFLCKECTWNNGKWRAPFFWGYWPQGTDYYRITSLLWGCHQQTFVCVFSNAC